MVGSNDRVAFAKHLFLGEIEFQAGIAERAASRLPDGRTDLDSAEAWGAVQLILGAAANVSKILWPSPKSENAERGTMLRELLGIPEEHILSDREIRNHFEHYDERLDRWLASSESENYVDQIIGELPYFVARFPKHVNRHYDPITRRLSFRGDSIDFALVLEALADLHTRCRQVVGLGGRATPANDSPTSASPTPTSPPTK